MQSLAQEVAGRLFFPLQNGQMIGVKKYGHGRLPLELSLTDQPTKTDNLRKRLVIFETAYNLFVPGFRLLPGKRCLEKSEFFFDTLQSSLELSRGLRHIGIVLEFVGGGKGPC
jgi:hypothetical protein